MVMVFSDMIRASDISGMVRDTESDRFHLEALLTAPARLIMEEEELKDTEAYDRIKEEAIEHVGRAIGLDSYTCMVAALIAKTPRAYGSTMRQHAEDVGESIFQAIGDGDLSQRSLERMAKAMAPPMTTRSYGAYDVLTNLAFIGESIAYQASIGSTKSEALQQLSLKYRRDPMFSKAIAAYQQEIKGKAPVRARYCA